MPANYGLQFVFSFCENLQGRSDECSVDNGKRVSLWLILPSAHPPFLLFPPSRRAAAPTNKRHRKSTPYGPLDLTKHETNLTEKNQRSCKTPKIHANVLGKKIFLPLFFYRSFWLVPLSSPTPPRPLCQIPF